MIKNLEQYIGKKVRYERRASSGSNRTRNGWTGEIVKVNQGGQRITVKWTEANYETTDYRADALSCNIEGMEIIPPECASSSIGYVKALAEIQDTQPGKYSALVLNGKGNIVEKCLSHEDAETLAFELAQDSTTREPFFVASITTKFYQKMPKVERSEPDESGK